MAYRWWTVVSGADVANRPRSVVLVAVDDEEGGCYLDAYDRDGGQTLPTTWHGSRARARQWALAEHQPADIGRWSLIPAEVSNAADHALRHAGFRGRRA
jgi:hypothetical protein